MARSSHTKTFVSCLYWWSFVVTSATPLARYVFSNQWYAVTIWGHVLPAYRGVAEDPRKDRAFGLHALFALLWITMAYVEMCFLSGSRHRLFGYLTAGALLLHSMASLLNLYEDIERHSLLNRLFLLLSLCSTVHRFVCAVAEAVRGNYSAHRVLMVRAFLSSLDGAGTIRTVAAVQMLFGFGPIHCECDHGEVGGHCDWTYCFRLLWVIALRHLQWAVFAKLEHRRLLRQLLAEVKSFWVPVWVLLTGCFAAGLDHQQTLPLVALAMMSYAATTETAAALFGAASRTRCLVTQRIKSLAAPFSSRSMAFGTKQNVLSSTVLLVLLAAAFGRNKLMHSNGSDALSLWDDRSRYSSYSLLFPSTISETL